MNWSSLCFIYLFCIAGSVSSFELSGLLLVLAVGNYPPGLPWWVRRSLHLQFTQGIHAKSSFAWASAGGRESRYFRSRAGRLSLSSCWFYCWFALVTQRSRGRKHQLHG